MLYCGCSASQRVVVVHPITHEDDVTQLYTYGSCDEKFTYLQYKDQKKVHETACLVKIMLPNIYI